MLKLVHPLLHRVPRLQMLAVFESAARLGSFTEAASEIGMTQSGVSRHISNLERTTSLELFHRSPNKVRLTAAGDAFLVAIQDGLGTIEQAVADLRRQGPTFLLAANPGFAQHWLVPRFDGLQALLGDADLRLRLFDRDSELEGEVYDAAIHLTSIVGAPPGSRVLFPEVVIPVAAPGFAEANGLDDSAEPATLLGVTRLHLDGRDRRWMEWKDWFAAHSVSWSPTAAKVSYNNYPSVLNDTIAGHGVALAWRGLVDSLITSGALVVVGPEAQRSDTAYQLIPGPNASQDRVDRLANWLARPTA
ncbi:MAG: LysR family transcriptional regulator [Acidimicrobiia bacterium]|nr:LysR family transcriptional regulator [Acidimicrobiia bacterium]